MSKQELIRRYCTLVLSVFIIALGITVIIRSFLGSPPISSTPYVFSVNTPLSIGTYLLLLNLLLIGSQMAMLGKKGIKESKVELLVQIPISVMFGLCTDLAMWMLGDLQPVSYVMQIATLLIGCVILAVGISLEVQAGVAMMSAEYTIQIAAKKLNKAFGTIKVIFDCSLTVLAIISSLLFTATVVGVREGTIIAAIITGPIVNFIMPRFRFMNRWHEVTPREVALATTSSDSVLITISREYGSGGTEIGKMIAQRLGIPFYDKNLIDMVAKEGEFSEKFVTEHEQNLHNSLYNLILQDYEAPLEKSLSPEDRLFVAQSKVISRIAEGGSCVIVGRCASYILDKYPNNISVFLHAGIEHKISRIVEKYGISADKAASTIKQIDKARSDHYFHYTGKRWGDARSYQLCCDSGLLTTEEICSTIEKLYHRTIS